MHIQTVTLTNIDRAVFAEFFGHTAAEVRAMPGCDAYELYFHAGDPERVMIFQRWQTQDDFEAYRNSKLFSDIGSAVKDVITAPPESLGYQAEPV